MAQPKPGLPAHGGDLAIKAESGGFLEFLFGKPRRSRTPKEEDRPQRRSYRPPPAVTTQPKDENAKRVYVIGDAFASGLGRSLEKIYNENPNIIVINQAKAGSGIVRDDYHDWNSRSAELLEQEKIDAVVVMVGSNDRQQMLFSDGSRESVRSEKWEAAYIERVDGILRKFAEKRIPIFWIGLPIMRSQSYGEDMAYLNEIFKARTSRFGSIFVETWDRFADEEGRYNAAGPDVAGRIRKLRSDNGIHMTRTGYEKIAYFLDKEMMPVLNLGIGLPTAPSAVLQGETGRRSAPRGPVEMEVSLTTPQIPEQPGELEGAQRKQDPIYDPVNPPPPYKVLVLGESVKAKEGRADDFSWPRPQPEPKAERLRGSAPQEGAKKAPPAIPLPPVIGGS